MNPRNAPRTRPSSKPPWATRAHHLVRRGIPCLALAAPLVAQEFRVSDPLIHAETGAVKIWAACPGGTRVVYSAGFDGELDSLFSAPADGSAGPVDLHAPLQFNSLVDAQCSGDTAWVAYAAVTGGQLQYFTASTNGVVGPLQWGPSVTVADFAIVDTVPIPTLVYRANTIGSDEIFAVPVDGSSSPRRINDPVIPGQTHVGSFAVSPDAVRVVYAVERPALDEIQLFTVPIDDSLPVLPLSGLKVRDYEITPDSGRVIYHADEIVAGVRELFSVLIDGSQAAIRLNDPGPVTLPYAVSPLSTHVLYLADVTATGRIELFVANIDGTGTPLKMNDDLPPNGDVSEADFSPDGLFALFLADEDNDDSFDLYLTPIDGSAGSLNMSSPLPASSGDVRTWKVSPDGTKIVFRADRETPGLVELYRVALPTPEKLSGTHPAGATGVGKFEFLPNSSELVFASDLTVANRREIYRVPVAGGQAPTVFNDPLAPNGDVLTYDLVFAGSGLVYLADQVADEVNELYYKPFSGGPSVRLNDAFGTGTVGDVTGFALSNDEQCVLYVADQEVDEQFRLFLKPVEGGSSVQLNATPTFHSNFGFTADDARALYNSDVLGSYDLYSIPTGGGTPVALSSTVPGSAPVQFLSNPDGSRVIYRAEDTAIGRFELFSRLVDGSLPPLRLNGTLANGGSVTHFGLAQNGTRAVYRADQDIFQFHSLYSAPITGGASLRISAANERVPRFLVSPDGNRVVYEHGTTFDANVSSVAADGSSSPIALTDMTGRVVFWYQVMPGYALVMADVEEFLGTTGLYSIPLLGGTPVRLTGLIAESERVKVSANGQRVIAWEGTALTSQTPDGIQMATLFGPLPPTETFVCFTTTPDGHVLFVTQTTSADFRIQRIRDDGSTPAELITNHPDFTSVDEILVTSDSRRAVFWGDVSGPGNSYVHSVPLIGGAAASFGDHFDVTPAPFVSPSGTYAMYISDRDQIGAQELFAARLRFGFDSLNPIEGPFTGEPVTLFGSGFHAGVRVFFGAEQAEILSIPNAGTLIVEAPMQRLPVIGARAGAGPGLPSVVTVDVRVSWNGDSATLTDAYTYRLTP